MITKTYIGIFFKPKDGGVICVYDPLQTTPRFVFFKASTPGLTIRQTLHTLTNNKLGGISIHVNDIQLQNKKQLAIYNQIIGILIGLYGYTQDTYKTVSKTKVKKRIMSLLDIKTNISFKSKIISKKIHNNQYNNVYDMIQLMSRQRINLYTWSYLYAYYGYLKDKVKTYNKKE